MDRSSIYRGCLTAVVMLLILTLFCIFNVEVGSSSFYLCIFSLMVDVPFLVFLIVKMILNYKAAKNTAKRDNEKKFK